MIVGPKANGNDAMDISPFQLLLGEDKKFFYDKSLKVSPEALSCCELCTRKSFVVTEIGGGS